MLESSFPIRTPSSYSLLLALILIGGIAGFPLVASVTSLLGFQNTAVSIAFRALVLGASLIVIVWSIFGQIKLTSRPILLLTLFLVFWFLYFSRMAFDTVFEARHLGRDPADYWLFGAGTCFFPALALAVSRRFEKGSVLVYATLGVAVIALGLASLSIDTTVENIYGGTNETGRYALETLNPISFGHLGTTVLLISYWLLRCKRPITLKLTTLLLFFFVSGVVAMLASASRGPLLAAMIGIIFTEYIKGGRFLLVLALVSIPVFSVVFVDFSAIDRLLGTQTISRVQAGIGLEDLSSIGRYALITDTWDQFLDNPILGSALENRNFKSYPHNILLEGFMAIGIFGGTILMCLVAFAVIGAIKIARRSDVFGVFALLFIQYLVAAQFTGSLYLVNTMWTLFGFIVMHSVHSGHVAMRRTTNNRAQATSRRQVSLSTN